MAPEAEEQEACAAADYTPILRKQRSCACPHPFVGNRRSRSGRRRTTIDADEALDPLTYNFRPSPPTTTPGPRLRRLWRRILTSASPAAHAHPPYDPYTYAQNFDEGSASVEPENLWRSFSARFAVPANPRMMMRYSVNG